MFGAVIHQSSVGKGHPSLYGRDAPPLRVDHGQCAEIAILLRSVNSGIDPCIYIYAITLLYHSMHLHFQEYSTPLGSKYTYLWLILLPFAAIHATIIA